nr:copia protein [Tanacetum cinerariifolium]
SSSSTNELNVVYNVSTATCHSSQAQGSSSYPDELMFSFFANQSSTPQLDKEDLEQINQDDLEEIDPKWKVAMLSMRVKQFYKKTRRKLEFNRKEPVGFEKTRSRDVGNAGYRGRDNGKKPTKDKDEQALVVQDGLGYDSQINEKEVLDIKEEEVTKTVFDNRSNDEENSVDALETSTACVEKPKEDRFIALIEDGETNSDDDSVFTPEPIPVKIDFVKAGNQTDKNTSPQETNGNTGTQDNVNAGKEVSDQHYTVLPLWSCISSTYKSSDDKPADDTPKDDTGSKTVEEPINKEDQAYRDEFDRLMSQEEEASDAADALRKEFEQGYMDQRGVTQAGSTNSFNTVCNPVNAASTSGTFSAGGPSSPHPDVFIPTNTLLHFDQDDSETPNLEETVELQSTGIFNSAYDDDLDIYTSPVQSMGAEADFNNMESFTIVIPIPTHKDLLDFVSFMEFNVYQMDVKSAFLYGTIEEEVYVSQPPGFIPRFPNKVYKIEKALYGLHQAPRAYKKYLCDEFEALMHKSFQLSSIGELTFFLGLLFTPKLSHLQAVKRIFRYLKGQPKLGLWYLRDSPFDWKPIQIIIVTTSTTEAEYVAAAHYCGQTEENVEFHQIVDFLSTCSISYALTVPRNHIGGVNTQTRFETTSKRSSDPPLSAGHIVGSGEDRMEQESNLTNFVPPTPYDSPLSGGHTPRTNEGRPNLLELMNICTKLSNMILSLQEAKTTQEKVITMLKLRVRRLEKKRKSRTSQPMKKRLFKGRVKTSTDKSLGEDASKQGRNDDQIEDLNLTNRVDTKVILEDKGSGEKEEKKLVEPESKDKKGKRIKRVVDSASKQKSFEKQKMMQEQESTKIDEEELEDYEQENEELRMWLTVVLDEEEIVDPEILSTNMMRKFDKQDLVDLHRLVMKRFDNTLEGYNFLLWGYLKNSYIADGWYFELLQHVGREKVSSHQGNAGEDVELEAELRVLWHLSFS